MVGTIGQKRAMIGEQVQLVKNRRRSQKNKCQQRTNRGWNLQTMHGKTAVGDPSIPVIQIPLPLFPLKFSFSMSFEPIDLLESILKSEWHICSGSSLADQKKQRDEKRLERQRQLEEKRAAKQQNFGGMKLGAKKLAKD